MAWKYYRRGFPFFLATILALTLGSRAFGSNDQEFLAANSAFERGDYGTAAESYQRIIDTGVTSSGLYFNLANAYLRQKEWGNAIANYHRSLSLAPDSGARDNLRKAREEVFKGLGLPPPAPAVSVPAPAWLSSYASATAFLLSYFVFAWSGYKLINKARPRHAVALTLSGAIVVYTGAILLQSLARGPDEAIWQPIISWSHPLVVTINSDTPLYAAPDSESQLVKKLPSGLELRSEAKSGEWMRISLADGRFGWLNINSVEVINHG